MLQTPMTGTAAHKRKQWKRKHIQQQDVRNSIRKQKHDFQRNMRNGKSKNVDMPKHGNYYKRIPNADAKYKYVP